MRTALTLTFIVFFISWTCDAAKRDKDYVKTSNCKKNKRCSYEYSVDAKIRGGEKIDVTAKVDIFCESVGVFKKEPSVRSCINVRDAVARLANGGDKYDADNVVPLKKLGNWFCFVQSTSSGAILGVFHAQKEENWIVNFKKNIASAFQANYKGTAVANETDSQSKHKSHYKYYDEGNKQIQERRINSRDVSTFAGKVETTGAKETPYFHEHDKIELDKDKRVQFSEGKAVLELGPEEEEKVSASSTKNDNDKGIPALGAMSDYKLRLSKCIVGPSKDDIAMLSAALASHECTVDELLARIDDVKLDAEEMEELNEELPSFDKTVKRVQGDAESQETLQEISNWRRLLQLESKNGALTGTEAKLPQLLQRLNEIKNDEGSNDERVLIYHLLSAESSLKSQQALVDMLKTSSASSSETTNLIVEIALLPAVHSSTIDALLNQYESLKADDDYVPNQLLLSISALGRYDSAEEKVVSYLSMKLASAKTPEETALLIHALGNTASKKIIPLLLPFLSDPVNQAYCIDALRTVSMDDAVEKGFASVVSQSIDPKLVLEVVESLLFPFKNSIYSFKVEKDLVVNEKLKTSLIEAGIKYNDEDLTKSILQYFAAVKDEDSSEKLNERLEEESSTSRAKRSRTSYWASRRDHKYNLVASPGQRLLDMRRYPYNRGYLWTKQVGYPKIHANIAAGGFGGIGIPGIKLYARARVDLVVWSRSYTALDILFSYLRVFPNHRSVSTLTCRRYIRIVGYTLLNEHRTTRSVYRYTRSWYKSILLFRVGYRHFIYVGTLHLTLTGHITGRMTFQAYIARLDNNINMKAAAELKTGPTLSVRGQAVAYISGVYKVGIQVTGSLSYHIIPEASTTVCDTSPKGDANACFEVYSQTNGRISIFAFWRRRQARCSWSWRGPRCSFSWTGRNRYGPLSRTWSLYSRRRKLYGLCRVCDCRGHFFLNVLCKGRRIGPSTCYCRMQYSGK